MTYAVHKLARGADLHCEMVAPCHGRLASRIEKFDRLQILLIEDDEADAYLIRKALAKNVRIGEVLLAEDGVEALELLSRSHVRPDLALVDLRMPRKDGLAFLKEVSHRRWYGLPCVVLTSSKSKKDAARATKRGAIAFVTKPKVADEMKAELDRIVARYG